MEITPSTFPFLNQDDFYYPPSTSSPHLASLFQDVMDGNYTDYLSFGGNTNPPSSKRRIKDEEEGRGEDDDGRGRGRDQRTRGDEKSSGSMGDMLTAFFSLDEQEKQEPVIFFIDSQPQHHRSPLLEANYDHKLPAMSDYTYGQVESHCTDAGELETGRTKRARRSASAAAGTMMVASSEESASHAPSASLGVAGQQQQQQRRLWVKDRSKDWWDRCNSPDFPEAEFQRAFRMSRATFDFICDALDPVVTKKNTMLRDAIPVRQRVAVCVWRLATGEPLRLVSKRFGLGISTCHKLVLEVCSAIRNVLMPRFLNWPDDQRLKSIMDEFESATGMPRVCGSMYTTHVPIIAPKTNVTAYLNKRHTERNQKTSYSITVQGVVDPRGVFTDVCIGWPGSMPDDQVLENSALTQRAHKGLLKDTWIAGSCGYPLMDWVLVPYAHSNLTWAQHAFNEKMAEVRSVAKEAFARLKGRWSCLQKRTEVKLQDLPVVLGACCVLHNICEMRDEVIDPELRFDIYDDDTVPENPGRSAAAAHARDQIAHNLLHHGLPGATFL